jgi:hypothetical protein
MRVSVDGGSTWTAWMPYASSYSLTLPSPDATYNVVVQVADKAGNYVLTTRQVTLDRTAPTLAPALSAPNNGAYYDVGTPITLTWGASDLNGIRSTVATIEGQTVAVSGGTIDVDVLTAGAHTVTITSVDNAGNVTTTTMTFTIHPSPQGILNAIYDGMNRGWITASYGSTLVTQEQQVIKAQSSSTISNEKTKLKQFITYLDGNRPPVGITAAYQTLLLNWANDLLGRL